MADDQYRQVTATRLTPAPLPSFYDLGELLARLPRYQDGSNLVTLSADAVPPRLASTFPLTMKEWSRALQRLVIRDYWQIDHRGVYGQITVIISGCIYRGGGVLLKHQGGDRFDVYIDGPPLLDEGTRSIRARNILSFTDLGDPPWPRPQTGYRVIPTLAEACSYERDVEVAVDGPGVVWHQSDGLLRLSQGVLYSDGPIVWVSGEPFEDELVHRGLVTAVDGAPARGWFWLTVAARLQSEFGASLAILMADTEGLSGEPTVLVRGVLTGIDLEPDVPVLLIEVPEPDGFVVCRVGLQAVGRMEIYPRISASGNFRQGFVEVGQLPPPEVARREALDRIRDGGDYLLLWQPYPDAFSMLQLSDVRLLADQIEGTRGDGLRLQFSYAEILAVQDPEASVQRRLAEKLAWWDVLPDLLAPLEGYRGTVVFAVDGLSTVHEGATYLNEGGGGFRFATVDGVVEVASDDLIAFEADCPECGGNHL